MTRAEKKEAGTDYVELLWLFDSDYGEIAFVEWAKRLVRLMKATRDPWL